MERFDVTFMLRKVEICGSLRLFTVTQDGTHSYSVPMTSLLDRSVNVKMVLSPHFSVGYQW